MSTIVNTYELIVVLRKSYSRHQLAAMIDCSAASIMRWEEGTCDAQARYVPGFNRAIHRHARNHNRFPEVRDAIAKSMKPRVLGLGNAS